MGAMAAMGTLPPLGRGAFNGLQPRLATTGTEMDSNPESGPCSTGGLSHPDIKLLHFTELKPRKVVLL